jgi:anti-sigma regulatory factor (Ser/Thr protein kinase)
MNESIMSASAADIPGPLHLQLPAEQDSLVELAEAVEGLAEAEAWPSEAKFHVDLVLEELAQNIISYGYPDGRSGQFVVSIQRLGDELNIVIEDDGIPFDPFSLAEPNLELSLDERAIGGLGVHFTRTLMDTHRYQRVEGHNRVELTKSLTADND